MTSEITAFIEELGGRRQRLLQLVRPADDPAVLVAELTELGEQLVIAEEELRVQQEELVAAGSRMQALICEREELRSSAPQPFVLTDRRGVVLRTNPAADRLIRRPVSRVTSRPIATWFEVADRSTVRTVISRLSSGQLSRAEVDAVLRRSDRSTLAVRVTAIATPARGCAAELELLWRLDADPEPSPSDDPVQLQLVADPASSTSASDLAAELTGLAVGLAACQTEQELLSLALEHARRLVPGARHAGLLLSTRRGRDTEPVPSDALAADCLRHELALREGPALAALAQRLPVLLSDTCAEPRWSALAGAAAGAGVRSVLAVEVAVGEKLLGSLAVYAEDPDAFGPDAVSIATLVAAQLGLGLDHLRSVRGLREGLDTRAVIGEAMGVLMERHRITSRDAFQVLVQASQENNVKLCAIAQQVAETGEDPVKLR